MGMSLSEPLSALAKRLLAAAATAAAKFGVPDDAALEALSGPLLGLKGETGAEPPLLNFSAIRATCFPGLDGFFVPVEEFS